MMGGGWPVGPLREDLVLPAVLGGHCAAHHHLSSGKVAAVS